MKEKFQEKLLVWRRLHTQCERLEMQLRPPLHSAESFDRDKSSAIEAELKALKARTEMAFRDASEELQRSETARGKPLAVHAR
jgi:hypothetical protein